jgi:hypothetical protein
MPELPLIQKIKDVSITKKLYVTVGAMGVLIALELFTLWFAMQTLSAVRAVVGAEGLWSKAQKDAIYYLGRYHRTHNEEDFANFERLMTVPKGDHIARVELMKEHGNLDMARMGFLQGRIHPDDIDNVIKLFTRFKNISYIQKAVKIWSQEDSIILRLEPLGNELHREIRASQPSKEMTDLIMEEMDPMNVQLTKLEDDFSYTLGEGSRWLENVVLTLLFTVALTVEVTGLLITISVSRSISKGLNEIDRATKKITAGNLSERVTVYSKDEIGQVALTINQMAEQLIGSNKELEQFAYIASHDLQEPLRSISNYVGLFQKRYKGTLDEDGEKYLAAISRSTGRMQLLIKDMLDYSRIGHDNQLLKLDCNSLVREVLHDMEANITSSQTSVYVDQMPVISGYLELKLVFQNLISNAIKFRKYKTQPRVNVMSKDHGKEWIFIVEDNGIGIEEKYFEKIFIIFQRLHSQKEYPGTGIGLAHCRKIVERHGGRISVQSEPGHGSAFYFSIPKSIQT